MIGVCYKGKVGKQVAQLGQRATADTPPPLPAADAGTGGLTRGRLLRKSRPRHTPCPRAHAHDHTYRHTSAHMRTCSPSNARPLPPGPHMHRTTPPPSTRLRQPNLNALLLPPHDMPGGPQPAHPEPPGSFTNPQREPLLRGTPTQRHHFHPGRSKCSGARNWRPAGGGVQAGRLVSDERSQDGTVSPVKTALPSWRAISMSGKNASMLPHYAPLGDQGWALDVGRSQRLLVGTTGWLRTQSRVRVSSHIRRSSVCGVELRKQHVSRCVQMDVAKTKP